MIGGAAEGTMEAAPQKEDEGSYEDEEVWAHRDQQVLDGARRVLYRGK